MLHNTNEERDILEVYNQWQHAYLHGDVETYSFYLDEDYHFIGSTHNEEFLTKNETIDFFKATAEQLNGKTEIRNNKRTIQRFGDHYFITDVLDGYFLSEGNWTYYGRFRFSSVMQRKPEGWRFIYQHFSTPDAKPEEGETIGYDQVSEENRMLREAVKRRTIELEHRNRELEIEASLEKVRAVAIGMQESNQLAEVVSVMYKELDALKIIKIGCELILCDTEKDELQIWSASAKDAYSTRSYHVSRHIHPNFEKQWQAWSNAHDRFSIVLTGKEKQEWDDFVLEKTAFSNYPDEDKIQIRQRQSHVLTHAIFRYGLLESVAAIPLPEEDFHVLRRFAGVFEQAYTRFLDLQKAEAQAREAQIEAALEKVRSRTMAMQKSEELKEVIQVVYEQFVQLNIHTEHTGFVMDYKTRDDYNIWIADQFGSPSQITIPYFDCIYYNRFNEAKKNGTEFFATVLTLEEKNRFYEDLFKHIPGFPEESKKIIFSHPGFTISTVLLENVALYIENFSGIPYSDEENAILMRFGKVFQQTYTRFLDLQKAEAQSREAEIQLALERVRARSLAMHQSDELREVVALLFEQIKDLGFDAFVCSIALKDKATRGYQLIASYNTQAILPQIYNVPYLEDAFFEKFMAAFDEGVDYKVLELGGIEKMELDKKFFTITDFRVLPEELKQMMLATPRCSQCCAYMKHGCITAIGEHELSVDHAKILQRFAMVFEQTYTRFLDLQKAEEQAREAQIEAALERVRSKTMAMHKSSELIETAELLFDQLKQLGTQLQGVAFSICDENSVMVQKWSSIGVFSVPYTIETGEQRMYEAWKNQEEIYEEVYEGERQKKYYELFMEIPAFRKGLQKFIDSGNPIPTWQKNHAVTFRYGYILFITTKPFAETQIFIRFAKVFEQTYTRFLDLQKAELQAKEAKIETALERVRARTMAMHNSEDVSVATATMFIELEKLGVENFRGGILNIRENKTMDVWSVNKSADSDPNDPVGRGKTIRASGEWNMTLHPWWELLYAGWVSKDEFLYYKLTGKEKEDYIKLLDARRDYIPGGIKELPDCHIQAYYFGEGAVWTFSLQPHSEENKQVMKRFASVFSLTFRRYQDLKKAEEQAREAQIDAALERVRARAMAMQESQELGDVAHELRKQMGLLGQKGLETLVIHLNDESPDFIYSYAAINPPQIEGGILEATASVPKKGLMIIEEAMEAYTSNRQDYILINEGEKLSQWFSFLEKESPLGYKKLLESVHGKIEDLRAFWSFADFNGGSLLMVTMDKPEDLTRDLLRRFSNVFGLAYRRFADIKQAEANAREARIEAAMEKVRARAMAMQKPGELTEVAELLRKEMGLLGVEELETSSIYIHNEATGTTECWYAIQDIRDNEKKLLADYMTINLHDTWVGREMLRFYNSDHQQVSILMKGENRKEWINYCAEHSKLLQGYYGEVIPERTYHLLKFSNGYIGAASPGDISKESWDLLKRATAVFSLAYTRFSDLQIAEASAKAAVKQATLDRIRADIASMRTVRDLDRITPLIWNELTVLGIPFIRCGVFIMDEKEQLIHTFLSNPEGKAIAAFHLPYDTPGNLSEVLNHWKDHKIYIDHWDQEAFTEMAAILVKQGAISTPLQYLDSIPHGGFYLHFLPFLQGMLYVGNIIQLAEDDIKLLRSVAEAFSTAYARYEDFSKLESAKQQVEKTLSDLKQAQTQLVQSEKMASLGELTAGIAHEIQNPLNFVNNFSDVSKELLEEMKDQLSMGNMQQAREIADDLIGNLEKILHHGKRADGIVKGMLQHSRTGSGQKELTDINALADEYLRLAYHGLRAKDKSFNAKFETCFDDSAGKINIIPQEMGRVMLNLINNAFYAVTEKRKRNLEGYEPTLKVSTARLNGNIEIRIQDNGIGIQQKVLDKIFQPFFTTKPTGQGTGLGLSLAYDIVKAHGGVVKVETKEGEGSTFFILLPQ